MSKPIDYDSPRQPAVEIDDDGLEDFKARSAAAQSPRVDLDEAEAAYTLERPVSPPACACTSHRWPSVRMYTSRRSRKLRLPFHQWRSILTD